MGNTVTSESAEIIPLNSISDGQADGCFVNERCMGTYIHGILDNGAFIDFLLKPFAEKIEHKEFDFASFKEEQYNKLADHVRNHVNMDVIYQLMKSND